MDKRKTFKEKLLDLCWKVLTHALPDKPYLSLKYRIIFKKKMNWSNPQTFNEKLQWLKLYGQGKEYTRFVDKILVKKYVAETIGEEYIIPTLGVWDSEKEIDFDALPDQFVLKCNHDSGNVVICKDKSSLNIAAARDAMKRSLRHNYFLMGRETPYKYVERKIFAEEFIPTEDGIGEIQDYKFFCFSGEPKIFKINFDRATDFHANYYDAEMNLLPFGEIWPCPDFERQFDLPVNFDKMLEICRTLSEGFPFVRVDLYNVAGKIYFGELTFYPTSGFGPFTEASWDHTLGSWLTLPTK